MADFALVALDQTLHASLGSFLDAYGLVRRQVEGLFPAQGLLRMQTQLRLLTPGGSAVRLFDGRQLPSDGSASGATQFDLVHLAAFDVRGPEALEARLAPLGAFLPWLRAQHAGGAVISASGSGNLLLVAAGLVDTLPIPLPRPLAPLCRKRFPRLQVDERRPVVEGERILMGAGPAADAELMVRVFSRTISEEMGRWLAALTGLDRETEGVLARDPLVADAQLWLEQRFAQDVRIVDLARAMSASHQTLIRRFVRELGVRPKDYVQQLRVAAAQRMLQRTRRSVEEIAALVGYRDTRSFRSVFREHAGMSPTAYRRLAQAQGDASTAADLWPEAAPPAG